MENPRDISNQQVVKRLKTSFERSVRRFGKVIAFLAALVTLWVVFSDYITTDTDEALLNKIEGNWGPMTRDGSANCEQTFSYSITRSRDETIITLSSNGFISSGMVRAFSDQSVVARTITPRDNIGESWELRIEEDRLLQIDKDGVTTTLARCPK